MKVMIIHFLYHILHNNDYIQVINHDHFQIIKLTCVIAKVNSFKVAYLIFSSMKRTKGSFVDDIKLENIIF